MTFKMLLHAIGPFIKTSVGFVLYSIWEYWLGRTKKFAANSTIELVQCVVKRLFIRKEIGAAMPEEDIKLGSVGDVDLKFSKGVASVTLSVQVPGQPGLSAGAQVSVDSTVLVNLLFSAIEKATPGAAPLEEAVKAVIIQAVQSIP